MKTLIDFPEEVATPLSSSPIQQISCQLNVPSIHFDAINYFDSDSETDETSSSTIADSDIDDSDSDDADSDIDENDVPYQDLTADGIAEHGDKTVVQHDTTATTNNNINDNNHTRKERSVSFGPIHVRQYERIVGDHPETKVGVPLSLGWAYNEDEQHPDGISIERFESDRIRRGKVRMSSITRKNMMMNVFGVPVEELKEAEKRSKVLRKQREKMRKKQQCQNTTAIQRLGKKIQKSGISLLKGMTVAAQMGMVNNSLSSAAERAF